MMVEQPSQVSWPSLGLIAILDESLALALDAARNDRTSPLAFAALAPGASSALNVLVSRSESADCSRQ